MNQYEQVLAELMSRGMDRTQAEQVLRQQVHRGLGNQDFLKNFTERSTEQNKSFLIPDDLRKTVTKGKEYLKEKTKQVADSAKKATTQAATAAQNVNPQGRAATLAGRAAPLMFGLGSAVQGDFVRAGGEVVGGLSGQALTQRAVAGLPIPGWAKVALAVGGSALGTGVGGTAASNIFGGGGGGNPNIPQTQTAKSVELPFGLGTYAFNEAARQDKRREQQFQQQLSETERMKRLDVELQKQLLQQANQATMQFNYQMSPLIERSKDLDRNRTAQLMNQQYGIDAGLTLLQNQGSLARQGMAASAQILSSMATSNPYAAALR
jgi:hypothetical protein